jgi:diacylglycerol kinase (ATP)
MKESGSGIGRIFRALNWSMSGLKATFQHEEAFRQELILCVILAPLALLLGETGVEKALLVGSLMLVLIVEVLNSAVEAAVDRISKEDHKLAGQAKDMGSAAVFLSLLNVLFVWILVLIV